MTSVQTNLRNLFVFGFGVLLLLGAVVWNFISEPLQVTPMLYGVKTAYLALMLIFVPVSSFYFTRGTKKLRQLEVSQRLSGFRKVYYLRFFALVVLAFLALPLWLWSGDVAYGMVYAVLLVLVGLMYPSVGFLSRELELPTE